MYTAAVIDRKDVQKLRELLQNQLPVETLGFEFHSTTTYLPHHMTINLGKFNEDLNDPIILDQTAEISISTFLYDENICCAAVDEIFCEDIEINSSNEHKHITMCLRPPTKPAESNKLFDKKASRIYIPETIIYAKIQEVKQL